MNERHATDQVHFGMWDYQMCYTQVYYSDDEGQTWQRGQSQLNAFVDQGRRGLFPFEEPSVAELPSPPLRHTTFENPISSSMKKTRLSKSVGLSDEKSKRSGRNSRSIGLAPSLMFRVYRTGPRQELVDPKPD